MADAAVWGHSIFALGEQPGRQTIHARADVVVAALSTQNLQAVRDNGPLERHASIHGWPERDDPDERKEIWKEICLHLSQSVSVRLVVPDAPITRGSDGAASTSR